MGSRPPERFQRLANGCLVSGIPPASTWRAGMNYGVRSASTLAGRPSEFAWSTENGLLGRSAGWPVVRLYRSVEELHPRAPARQGVRRWVVLLYHVWHPTVRLWEGVLAAKVNSGHRLRVDLPGADFMASDPHYANKRPVVLAQSSAGTWQAALQSLTDFTTIRAQAWPARATARATTRGAGQGHSRRMHETQDQGLMPQMARPQTS